MNLVDATTLLRRLTKSQSFPLNVSAIAMLPLRPAQAETVRCPEVRNEQHFRQELTIGRRRIDMRADILQSNSTARTAVVIARTCWTRPPVELADQRGAPSLISTFRISTRPPIPTQSPQSTPQRRTLNLCSHSEMVPDRVLRNSSELTEEVLHGSPPAFAHSLGRP